MHATTAITAVAFLATGAAAAALQNVTMWGGPNPNNLTMDIYVPDVVPHKPALVLAPHWCHGSAWDMFTGTEWRNFADKYGFIVIYPDNPTRDSRCWDVCTPQALKHNGGSDTLTMINMVKYAQKKYKTDLARTFVTGISSGAMATQALIGAYPDVFAAGASMAGVPFGCFATTDPGLWNSECASGNITHTGKQWADMVKRAYPAYRGQYPRIQLWHGTDDEILNYQNHLEALKEWTTILGVQNVKPKVDAPEGNWTRSQYTKNGVVEVEAYSLKGSTHNLYTWVPSMVSYAVKFFGLDKNGPVTTTTVLPITTTAIT
ncbi:hypothetical protein HDV00_002464 [Rhizophlyctis rosea]|nr:hypothetical protein HDV00_002464 [Rhizophlyctis rosea]